MLFDTHVHLNAKQFEDDREKTIQRAYDAGVKNMVVVGFDRETIPLAIEIAESYPAIYAAVGWHPVDAIDMTEEDLKWIEQLSFHPKVVAIGEMGLDYHWDKSPRDIQKEVFRKQIALAKKVNMPIIIHNREATEDIIKILQEENAKEIGGIMHCYNDSVKYVQDCLDMNFYISLGGPVTFKNAPLPKEVAKEVPLDRLLIETDAPFLAPHPNRGKRNEPAYVRLVAEQIASLRDMSVEEIGEITTRNARQFFNINE
ncbi:MULTISPECIES: TatD family hydrolase [Oceanobacillus]|uniref:Hydrolase TatD n=1 Tax=Oceanobacillus kimchii TaxID=746691 RepID=A0ABQ5TDW1_9BACI|nr:MULTISPECIES: TatD family hydrolase [Oceanobacillus]MBT2599852.1 TatD family hydrolase [Oceanobacillus sp. ISL-74]MBT2652698.1 TatD family hydrolase [Oceanobacillus sp. ISL-73]MCT1577241.1 TatD family hydrolase [Oceanobacillus kimchii]MCT2135311.1 TatD family hydrolase [Oceanobacillus kimchii]OEH56576.1 hydrolase TatD [Oceanobacillus sp. E9]